MTVGRPDLVETIATVGRADPSYVDYSTRYQMEAGQLDKVKGRRTPRRRSYGPKEGSAALLGLAARSASGAPEAYTALAVLRAVPPAKGIDSDPVGRLLPALTVPVPDEDEDGRIKLHPLLTAMLGNISGLSAEEAAALRRAPETKGACLELSSDPASALFRWNANGEDHQVEFKHPGTPLAEIFGEESPAYQTVTKLYFPLLFAVGRLFAAAPAHDSVDPDPSSGEATASAHPEKGNAARPGAASLGNWSRNSRTRPHTPGKVGGGGEILKLLPLSRDRLPVATSAQGYPARCPPPTT